MLEYEKQVEGILRCFAILLQVCCKRSESCLFDRGYLLLVGCGIVDGYLLFFWVLCHYHLNYLLYSILYVRWYDLDTQSDRIMEIQYFLCILHIFSSLQLKYP
jgi:hypothetical protein